MTKDDDNNSIESPNLKDETKSMNPLAKASWYAAEFLGNVVNDDKSSSSSSSSPPPTSLEETLERIKIDNDKSYFLSGIVDEGIYDEDCLFADPFASFRGRDRFVNNLSNLGSFVTNYSAKMLQYDTPKENEVATRVMVKLELNLPWKPILAWPWGVRYIIDPETFLITTHEESWDIEPWEGVKQVFRKGKTTIGRK